MQQTEQSGKIEMNLYSIESIHLKTLKKILKKKKKGTNVLVQLQQPKKKSPKEKFESEKWRRCTVTR